MKRSLLVALVSCVAVAGCAATGEGFTKKDYDFSKIKKVAVVGVKTPPPKHGGKPNVALNYQIGDLVTMEMFKQNYDMVERVQMESILKEQKFQNSEATSDADAVQMGKILNVQAVILANVSRYGEDFKITAKMIEVETGSVLWIGEGFGSENSGVSTVAGGLLGAGGGAAAGRAVSKKGTVPGAVAGGVGGTLAGKVMEPRIEEVAKSAIQKMCSTLPSK